MKLELKGRQKNLFEFFLFIVKLTAFSIPLYAILAFSEVLLPLQEAVSHNVQFLLGSTGMEVVGEGIFLKAGSLYFLISGDCTGWKSMLLLTGLILSVPAVGMRKRLTGLAAGLPLLYLGNLARIIIMVFVSLSYGSDFASVVHDYLWQAGLVSLVLVIWISWLFLAGKLRAGGRTTFLKRLHKFIKPR